MQPLVVMIVNSLDCQRCLVLLKSFGKEIALEFFLSTLTSAGGWYVSCGLGWLMQIASLPGLMGPEGTSASVAHR